MNLSVRGVKRNLRRGNVDRKVRRITGNDLEGEKEKPN